MKLTKLIVGAFALSAMLVACDSDSASAKDTEIEELSSSSEGTQSSSSSENISAGSVYDATAKTLTDLRDGQTYKTVTIGDQTWMAENLNYAYTGVPYEYIKESEVYASDSTSWCYENDPANCTKYGRLYTWAAAVGKTEDECGYENECNLPSGNIQGVCPSGWHLPSEKEFETLFTAVGGQDSAGTALKSTSGWYDDGNGTDAFGFSALPAGKRLGNGGYYYEGERVLFWSSTEYDSYGAYGMYLYYYDDYARLDYYLNKYRGHSVRCVKD